MRGTEGAQEDREWSGLQGIRLIYCDQVVISYDPPFLSVLHRAAET